MAISHRTNRLKLIGTPAVEQLQNGRYQLTVNCTTMNSREDWYSSNKSRIFPDFGTLQSAEMSIDGLAPRTGEAYTDMRLVSVQSSTQEELYIVTLVYQTLGDSFVQVKDDNVNYIENGLRRVTRKSIAKAGTDFQKTVGTTSITSQIDTETAVTCILANYEVDDTDSYREVTEVYIEAGTLSETTDKVGSQLAITIEAFGEVPSTPSGYELAKEDVSDFEGISTNRYTFLNPSVLSRSIRTQNNGALIIETVEAFNETPTASTAGAVNIGEEVSNVEGIPTRRYTFAKGDGQIQVNKRPASPSLAGVTEVTVVSYGTEVTPTGVLIAESETEEDGYVRYTKTALQGDIVGVKQTYKDVVDVEVPGEVECTTIAVSSGGVSGTIAVPKVTPRRSKKVVATVEVEITTTPPDTASVAFDLGEISCSVTSTNVSLTRGPGSTVSVGTTSVVSDTGYVQNFGASANISVFPGCYLIDSSSDGVVSYVTSSQPVASGNIISRDEASSSRSTKCEGTGETAKTGYVETGIIRRNSRPILTTLGGVTYYEVITWSV
jgi:hypothetical protein